MRMKRLFQVSSESEAGLTALHSNSEQVKRRGQMKQKRLANVFVPIFIGSTRSTGPPDPEDTHRLQRSQPLKEPLCLLCLARPS